MNRAKSKLSVALLLLMLVATRCTLADDWPQWRGPNRDNVVKGFVIPKEWPKELTSKWKTEVGQSDASPSLAGERVFVFVRQGDDETMLALDASNGQVIWQEKQPAVNVSGGARQHPGPRSTPTVVDGKVYALGVGGLLSCWDAANGQVVWRKDSKEFSKQHPMFFTAMSPIVVDGVCIAHLGGEGSGAVVAYDKSTGDEKWRWNGEGPSYGSPVVATIAGVKQVVMETEKSVVGIAVDDGRLLWQHPLRGQPSGTPIVDGDTVIFTVQGTTAVKIEKQADGFKAEPLWTKAAPSPRYVTPVLKNGFLYGCTSSGNLYCMDAKTGEFTWTDTTRRGDPTNVLDAGSVLLAVSNNSELTAFQPNDKEYLELARIKVADSPVWGYPIIVGNRIFVKDMNSVTLWTIE